MKNERQIVSFWSKIITQFIAAVSAIVYLFFLNHLNDELRQLPERDAFTVAMYDNGKPVLFVLLAIILTIVSISMIIWCYKAMVFEEFNFHFIGLFCGVFILNLILLVLIFIFINDPILRCVLFVFCVGAVAVASINNN